MDLIENKILQIQVGSKLFGTDHPDSDDDFSGIFIAPQEFYLGLSKVEEVDCSFVSKGEDGRNDSNAIDYKLYEFRKFCKLAMENNPNIIEQLFVPKNKVIFSNEFGDSILAIADMFPWIGLEEKFLGYAYSQKHKMIIKTNNYSSLKAFGDWLDEHLLNPREDDKVKGKYFSNQLLAELRVLSLPFIKFHEHHALVGDINISLTDKLCKVQAKTKDRLSKVGNREELYTKYGYDTKFGMSLVRLMLEGKELLTTGRLEFPLKDREMLKDIRFGKWKKEEILKYAEDCENEIKSLSVSSKLPSRPRYKEIEGYLIKTVLKYWER